MQAPLELAFRNVEPSDSIMTLVAKKAAHLESFFDGITSCHVYIRAPHRSQLHGNLFEVTIEVRVPGAELVVRKSQNDAAERERLTVAVRGAFGERAYDPEPKPGRP